MWCIACLCVIVGITLYWTEVKFAMRLCGVQAKMYWALGWMSLVRSVAESRTLLLSTSEEGMWNVAQCRVASWRTSPVCPLRSVIGLFATQTILDGAILEARACDWKRVNDADMTYPTSLTVQGWETCRKEYEALDGGKSRCNLVPVALGKGRIQFQAVREILPGEELTKRYGSVVWRLIFELELRCFHSNPEVEISLLEQAWPFA